MAGRKVLVVDDDEKIVELVKMYLYRDGYKVYTAYDGIEGLKLAREKQPDLIVLDLMLPGMDGLEVCRTLRDECDVPIIMLTAKTTDEDRLRGLDMGADDYVSKPFSPRELAARVRAVLRRMPGGVLERGPEEITRGQLCINFIKQEVVCAGKAVKLTPAEFKLLGILVRDPGRVFSRAELIERALGFDFEGFDRTIDVHILNIRRKLNSKAGNATFIETVYGSGYRFKEK